MKDVMGWTAAECVTAMTAQRAIQSQVDAGVVSAEQVLGVSCRVTASTTVGTARSVVNAVNMETPATQ